MPLITIAQASKPKQLEQTITLTISGTCTSNLVPIEACEPDSGHVIASFFVNILPKLQLPDFATEAGAVAHLLLAESITPNYRRAYGNSQDVFGAMELMRKVLDNRLAAAQSSDALRRYVACSTSANDLRDIVRADQCGGATAVQFDGFDGQRNAPHENNLRTIRQLLLQANDGSHPLFEKSRAHIEKAIEIASRAPTGETLSETSLFFWKTETTAAPSSYTKLQRNLANQDFYSLNSNYLKNPQNPAKH